MGEEYAPYEWDESYGEDLLDRFSVMRQSVSLRMNRT